MNLQICLLQDKSLDKSRMTNILVSDKHDPIQICHPGLPHLHEVVHDWLWQLLSEDALVTCGTVHNW